MASGVALSGFLTTVNEWDDLLWRLKRLPCRPVSLPEASSWQAGTRETLALLPDKCWLMGYSMSARVALGCAVCAPERFEALILISGHCGLAPADREARKLHDDDVANQLERLPPHEFLTQWYDQPLFRSVSPSQRADWIAQRANLCQAREAALLRSYSIANQPNYLTALNSLPIPTLLLVGSLDAKYVAIASTMERHWPEATMIAIPAVGHAPHREASAEVARAINSWWNTLTTSEKGNRP